MSVERKHLAGLELALSIADTVCTDSIGVGQLEALIEQAKAAPNCGGHAESGWQSFYAVGDQGQQYRCIRCGAGGASPRGSDKPLTYNCHNPQCGGKVTMWPTPQYDEYRELAAERERLREALTELLGCPANVVLATVPRSGIESAPPYQVVLDVSVSLTRWQKAKAALDAQP